MANPAFPPTSTKPGSAGWYEPDGSYHPFDVDREPDGEYAARVKDTGARAWAAALAGAIQAASPTDQVRAVRAGIDSLLYEMQHPKQPLFTGADVALPAGGASIALTPWIDVRPWRWVGYYIANTGANVLTASTIYVSESPGGAAPFLASRGPGTAIGAGNAWFTQYQAPAGGGWTPGEATWITASYLSIATSSALGSTARCCVVGMR